MSSQCEQIKKEYEEIKTLKKEFDLEFAQSKTSDKIKELKAQLEQKTNELSKKIWHLKHCRREN